MWFNSKQKVQALSQPIFRVNKFGRPFLFATVLLVSGLFTLLSPSQTATARPLIDNDGSSSEPTQTRMQALSTSDRAKAFAYYKALRHCMEVGWYKNSIVAFPVASQKKAMSAQNAVDWEWFHGYAGWSGGTVLQTNSTTVGVINDLNDDGDANCGDTEGANLIQNAAKLWGYTSGPQLLCQLGFQRQTSTSCSEIIPGANNDFIAPDNAVSKLDNFWTSAPLFNGNTDVTKLKSIEYKLYYDSFMAGCKVATSGSDYSIKTFIPGSNKPATTKYGISDRDIGEDHRVQVYHGKSMTCRQLADQIDDSDDRAVKNYTEYLSALSPEALVEETKPSSSNLSPADDTGTACAVDGLGWILCPVINAMAGMADGIFGIVAHFMNVEPLGFNTDNPLYSAWAIMRNIANVAFVIAFFFIIFSQLTGAGISNYGVKKMLPRLVVAAVLVNVSYFICALAVDASNILGWSAQQALTNMADQVVGADNNAVEQWGSIATSVLSLGTIGTGAGVITAALMSSLGIWSALAGLLPLLVTALFAIIVAFLVLLARQAFIIMLIVISPLAFVAFLLPNTEGLFKKWRSFFVTLLALFPMMALVFGGSALASAIMRQGSESMIGSSPIVGFFMYLGSVAVLAIPFFITPVLIRLSGGVLNRFAGMINNPNKGPFDKMRKGAERIRDNSRNRTYANRLKNGGFDFGAKRRARVEAISSGLENEAKRAQSSYIADTIQNDSKFAQAVAGGKSANNEAVTRAVAGAINIDASLEADEVKADRVIINQALSKERAEGRNTDDYLKAIVTNPNSSASQKSAALDILAATGRDKTIREVQAHAVSTGDTDLSRRIQDSIMSNTGALSAKAPDLVKGSPSAAFDNIKGSDLVGFSASTAKAHTEHLRALFDKAKATGDPNDAAAFNGAISSFLHAVEDVRRNPTLQAQFGGDVGLEIKKAFSGSGIPSEFAVYNPSDIDSTSGKIR